MYLTSERVLRKTFAGQNHLFLRENKFFHLKGKESAKITQKNMHKRGVYQGLGVTLKRWLTPKSCPTPGENVIFLILCMFHCVIFALSFLFSISDRKRRKNLFSETNDFDQRTAPVCWSKSYLLTYLLNELSCLSKLNERVLQIRSGNANESKFMFPKNLQKI